MTTNTSRNIAKSPGLDGLAPRVVLTTADEWNSFRKRDTRLFPKKKESFSGYLNRVQGWKYFNDSSRFEESASWAAEKVYITYSRGRDALDELRYRVVFRGYCPCTDVMAQKKVHTFWPTLSEFQQTATAGCERCCFIVQSIALFQARFTGVDPGRIQVHLKNFQYPGDFSRIRVRWLPDGSIPNLEPYSAQLRQEYVGIDLELYADEGE